MNPEFLCRIDSPIGRLQITSNGKAITSLAVEASGLLPHDHLPEAPDRLLSRCSRQLDGYFAGTRRTFTLPVSVRGTPFQQSVWKQLTELGWGDVTTYGDIARVTGQPAGGRAVGGAVRANPIPVIIPCHRVLALGGRITGYSHGSGVATKAWLLDHEGIVHATRTVGHAFTTEEILGLPSPDLIQPDLLQQDPVQNGGA